MKRIDFIGPPGSGKTTLVKKFIQQNKNPFLIDYENEVYNVIRKYYLKDEKSIKTLVSILISKIYKKRRDLLRVDKGLYHSDVQAGIGRYFDLINWYYINSSISDNGLTMHSYRYHWLVKQIEELVILEMKSGNKIILFDESITNRIINSIGDINSILRFFDNNKSFIPDAYIYLDTSINESLERLSNRARKTVSHQIKSNDNIRKELESIIEKTDSVEEIFLKNNCNGLRLNSSYSISECIFKINNFIVDIN